jgi:hypothetical protein
MEIGDDLERIQEYEKSHWQLNKLIPIWTLILILIVSNLLKGSKTSKSIAGFEICETWYWMIHSIFVMSTMVVIYLSFRIAVADHQLKKRAGYKFLEGDIIWNFRMAVIMMSFCFIAGVIASLVGLGGGVIYTPLLLEMGVHP